MVQPATVAALCWKYRPAPKLFRYAALARMMHLLMVALEFAIRPMARAASAGGGRAKLAGDALLDGAVGDHGLGPDAADAAAELGAAILNDAVGDGGAAARAVDAAADGIADAAAGGWPGLVIR